MGWRQFTARHRGCDVDGWYLGPGGERVEERRERKGRLKMYESRIQVAVTVF